jgi:hypothetical protein
MARGFTNIMKDKFGFSCENIGVIGDKKFGRLYINYRNSFVGIETFLNKKWSNLDIFFDDIRKERDSLYKKIISNYNFDNPIKSLLEISVSYQEFVNIICFYDCFTKYLDNMDMHGILRPSLRYRISFDHANAVNGQIKFIFKVRKLFQRLGKKTLISPDLFRSMTVDELEVFAKTQSLNMDQSRELLCRKFKYYYFYFSDIKKDILIDNDDKDMIHFINKTFFLDKKKNYFWLICFMRSNRRYSI